MISVIKAIANTVLDQQSLPQHVCLFYRKEGYSVGSVELDLILSEEHSKSAQVTENPLQYGKAISDGIYNELRDGSLIGLVSNHSLKQAIKLSEKRSILGSVTDYFGITRPTDELMTLAESYALENRARQAWEDLKSIMDAKQTVKIVTALETYDNVAITNISTERNGDSGDALEIKISFRQILTVALREHQVTAQVQPKDMDSDINRKSAVGTNSGQKVASEPTEAEKKQLNQGIIEAD